MLPYAGLFGAAFFAATLLPAQSEALLFAMLVSRRYDWQLLVLAASLGNILGSIVNWVLGLLLAQFGARRWLPISHARLMQAEGWYRRYGRWSLLMSWVPFIGDPLTFAAGFLRERFLVFVLLVSAAKSGRYLVVAMIATNWH